MSDSAARMRQGAGRPGDRDYRMAHPRATPDPSIPERPAEPLADQLIKFIDDILAVTPRRAGGEYVDGVSEGIRTALGVVREKTEVLRAALQSTPETPASADPSWVGRMGNLDD